MKSLKMTPKRSKISKVSNFQCFSAFFPKFATDFVKWNVEEGHKKKMCCPVGFSKQFIAVYSVILSQIDTDNNKKPKTFQQGSNWFSSSLS